MNYISTRGGSEKVSSAQAIKQGLCNDGGLFMPETIPALTLDDITALSNKSYAERAAYILCPRLTLTGMCRFKTDSDNALTLFYSTEHLICQVSSVIMYSS